MTFPFDVTINLNHSGVSGVQNKSIKINGPVTTFLGPNGSGKTQLLRGLKKQFEFSSKWKDSKIRFSR